MKSAGKVLPRLMGEYDPSVTYDVIDFVTYNGFWICKQPGTVGIEPSEANSDHWMLVMSGSGAGGDIDLSEYAKATEVAELKGALDEKQPKGDYALKSDLEKKQPVGDYALRSEIPSIPVESVNGKTGAVVLNATDVGATTKEYVDSEITDLKAQGVQQVPSMAQGDTLGECLAWLETNGDTSKTYIMKKEISDEVYAYILTEVEPAPLFTNVLDSAEIKNGYRYSKSGAAFKEQAGCDAVIFKIPSSGDITIRLHNCERNSSYPQIYGGTTSTAFTVSHVDNASGWSTGSDGDQYATFTNSAGSTYVCVMMNTVDTSTAIITVNEEIKYSAGGKTYAWDTTGHAFIPTDYEDRIIGIEDNISKQEEQIANLEKKVENIDADENIEAAYSRIKNWNYPIYENAPVFLLETNKPAMGTTEPMTADGIYAKYDALMAEHSHYITRENCGMASDGTTPIYTYHFKEPDPRSPYQGMWREKKPVILVCSGVHQEWAGVYCMYYAMEEITTNPKLLDLRRNVHFIITPMLNPTAASDAEYKMRNPDGIQVHHNFEVGHGENGAVQGDRYYGGETPLSIPETQYFDALMNQYKNDLACVLSCHNNVVDEKYGTGFIWCSCATYFMTNLGNRLAEKMSSAWLEKHGDTLTEGIRWANNYALEQAATGTHPFFKEGFTALQPEWDLRIGWAGLSGSGGTEYRHGMKYGIHGINVEVCPRCVLDKDYNAEYTSNVMTMGAETYINFFRTYMAVYDIKNKKDYAPNLPWKE